MAAAWAATAELLLHPHAWVRMAAGRLLGLAFAEPKIGEHNCCTKPHMWAHMAAGYLLGLCSAVCAELCFAIEAGLCVLQTAAKPILPPLMTDSNPLLNPEFLNPFKCLPVLPPYCMCRPPPAPG